MAHAPVPCPGGPFATWRQWSAKPRWPAAGVFLGQDGRPVPTALDSRMIVTPGSALAQIPCVIAVAYGVSRAAAVRAAIRGGMIKGLVTHTSLARTLLGLA